MKYELWQLPLSEVYKFRQFDASQFSILDYVQVYSGESLRAPSMGDYEFLEILFEMFNLHFPDDYHGASMSVSDVICLIDGNLRKWYYVEPVGFKCIEVES